MKNFLFLVFFLISSNAYAHQYSLEPAKKLSMEDFEELFSDVNNWGRWGKDDQLGTLNNIDASKRVIAAKLVKEGLSVSMEFPITEKGDPFNPEPLQHDVMINDGVGWFSRSAAAIGNNAEFDHVIKFRGKVMKRKKKIKESTTYPRDSQRPYRLF